MRFSMCLGFVMVFVTGFSLAVAQEVEPIAYKFTYDFDAGGQLSGTFEGFPTDSPGSVFEGTITVLDQPTIVTYVDPSGYMFDWDTNLPDDSSSQFGLISPSEYAFVSLDGSKMDLTLSSGSSDPTQVYLENGIHNGGLLNRASSLNLLATDLSESFRPESWSLMVVPEPAGTAVGMVGVILGWTLFRRKRHTLT